MQQYNGRIYSEYIGVHWHHQSRTWRVEAIVRGERWQITSLPSEIVAAEVYDLAITDLTKDGGYRRRLNFPERKPSREAKEIWRRVRGGAHPVLRDVGVHYNASTGKWDAVVSKKHIGSYEGKGEAIRRRDLYIIQNGLVGQPYIMMNFPVQDYQEEKTWST